MGFVVNPGGCYCYPRIYSQGYSDGLSAGDECKFRLWEFKNDSRAG